MNKLMKVRLILNKKNGQINIPVPKKEFDKSVRCKIKDYKSAFIKFEGFE